MNPKKLYALLYKSFVCKDAERPSLMAVVHKNGRLYASDGQLLARVGCDYPQELEGKAKNKTGEDVPNTVNYDGVIPTRDRLTAVTVNHERLKAAVTKIKDVKVTIRKTRYPALIKVGGDFYRAEHLKTIFDLFDVVDDDFTLFTCYETLKPICAQGILTDTLALAIPCVEYGEQEKNPYEVEQLLRLNYTIDTALEHTLEVKPKNKTWYEK